MKLDRNLSPGHPGKYALIKIRDLPAGQPTVSGPGNEKITVNASCVDFGDTPDTEFFVLRLKDKWTAPALFAYANAAEREDPQYATQVRALAELSRHHPNKKRPD